MIPIRNVYHMLAYAFQNLREQGLKDVAVEEFPNAAELLAAILSRLVSIQIKRGLRREYVARTDAPRSPRGRIDAAQTFKTQAFTKKRLVCDYDEFSVDSYSNRIVKTALETLLKANISRSRKRELRQRLLFFADVSPLDRRQIDWNRRGGRDAQSYQTLIEICRLALDGLLPTNAPGSTRIVDFLDERSLAALYEKFVLEYFRREHPELRASSPHIRWKLDSGFAAALPLPIMRTDVVLQNRETRKTLIIDAKYYSQNTRTTPFGTRTLDAANLYQIFAYVENWPAEPGETVSGLLLYAKTDAAVQPDGDYQINGNQISAKTLDLGGEFLEIAAQLDKIAETLKN